MFLKKSYFKFTIQFVEEKCKTKLNKKNESK